MAQTVTLNGVNYDVPEKKETGWGNEMTNYLVAIAAELDPLAGGMVIPNLSSAESTSLTEGATLTQTAGRHRVASSGGAITLDTTTAIADGAADAQQIVLLGTSDANTVTVPDAANTKLNSSCTLGQGDQIYLIWDSGLSLWMEMSRNN